MKVIACIDDNGGILFNNRRVSRDKLVIENILDYIKPNILYITDFSTNLFADHMDSNKIKIIEEIDYGSDDYYFIENISLNDYCKYIDEIVIYKWNRVYPSDFKFNIDLNCYNKIKELEFVGNSHDLITREIYSKKVDIYE